jgi:large subunit ribosomal protein L1|tara:strand:- start:371 stop:1099 length:729 start_codon:yes stop_codon:yes gene_type:complete
MDKKQILQALKFAKELSQKRNFKQSVELIINLKGLNLKKPEHQVDLYVNLHKPRGKEVKLCALIGIELQATAKENCDNVILLDDFIKFAKDKKATKKLANEYDFFIAQANIMPKVASTFGRVLGPKGKMPNPKAGCVVPPKANLKSLKENLKNTVKVTAKVKPIIQCTIGKEDMDDADLAENIMTVYDQLVHHLPNEVHNIKSTYIKLTMGKSIKVGQEYKAEEKKEKPAKEKAEKKDEPKK